MKSRFILLALSSPFFWKFLRFQSSTWTLDAQLVHNIGVTQLSGVSRIFINKTYILVDEFFKYLSALSPRAHFNTESILPILFSFWVLGIIFLIREKKYMPLFLSLILPLTSFVYLYISLFGMSKFKAFRKIYIVIIFLNIFLTLRLFLI